MGDAEAVGVGETREHVAPRATVVIVAYRRPESLRLLLEAVASSEIERIVCNVTADPDVEAVALNANAKVIPIADNVGFGTGVNAGARAARAECVVFCNDDLVVSAATILGLADCVAGNRPQSKAVFAPLIVNSEGLTERTIAALPNVGTLIREYFLLPDQPMPLIHSLVRVEKWRVPSQPEIVPAVSGAIIACSRQLLIDTPLPEDYFLYWEEMEWFYRLAREHVDVWYRPEFTAHHSGGREDVRPEKSRLIARNAVRCVRRTGGRRTAFAAWIVVIAWQLRLVALDALRVILHRRESYVLRARCAGLGAALLAIKEVFM